MQSNLTKESLNHLCSIIVGIYERRILSSSSLSVVLIYHKEMAKPIFTSCVLQFTESCFYFWLLKMSLTSIWLSRAFLNVFILPHKSINSQITSLILLSVLSIDLLFSLGDLGLFTSSVRCKKSQNNARGCKRFT